MLTLGRQAEIQRENAYLVKSIQQAQQRSSMLAKTLSVGVLQPRKFAAPAQKAFRTHKGFHVDAELEDRLMKIRTELEGTSESIKPHHKLNILGRLPHPATSQAKETNTSMSDVANEANNTQVGFEVVFVNPRLSQENHGIDMRSSNMGIKKRVANNEISATDRIAMRGRDTYSKKASPRQNVEQCNKTDGFMMELIGLDNCIIKIVWEDFTPVQEREDDASKHSEDDEASDKYDHLVTDINPLKVPEVPVQPKKISPHKDEGDTIQTACSNTAISDLILEDLISLRKGQTLKKEFSFQALGAHQKRGIKFVLSLLAGDGSCISSTLILI